VQIRAAGAVDPAGVLAIERLDVLLPARRVFQIDMCQTLPAFADSNHVAADFAASINDLFDYRIQSGNVTAPSENTNTPCGHPVSFF
jgi:hypothetical protein